MRLFIAIVTLSVASHSALPQGGAVDIRIEGNIPVIQQPKTMDCWITVATMLLSWKENKTYTVETVANRLGDPWKLYYELNTGLPAKDQHDFIKYMHLKEEPPANYTIQAYYDFLKAFGPLWIITGDGFSAHARILIGLRGSGEYGNTQFILIDPATGKKTEQESMIFLKEFEEEARVANEESWKELRIQVFHF